MTSRWPLVLLGVIAVVTLGGPAGAEHLTLVDPSRGTGERPREGSRLDLQLKIGADQFGLSARLFGPNGVAGGWLNGERGPHGFSLDGRLQDDRGRVGHFRLDADVIGGLGRSLGGRLSRGLDALE